MLNSVFDDVFMGYTVTLITYGAERSGKSVLFFGKSFYNRIGSDHKIGLIIYCLETMVRRCKKNRIVKDSCKVRIYVNIS